MKFTISHTDKASKARAKDEIVADAKAGDSATDDIDADDDGVVSDDDLKGQISASMNGSGKMACSPTITTRLRTGLSLSPGTRFGRYPKQAWAWAIAGWSGSTTCAYRDRR